MCSAHAFAAKSLYMAPSFGGEGSPASIIAWKSPITGSVTVSGSLQLIDPNEQGITWELDQGATTITGPTDDLTNSTVSFGPTVLSVSAGQSLYLEVGAYAGASFPGGADETDVNFTITT